MIIKGVGTMLAKRICADGSPELLTLGTLQDLRITMSVDVDEIFGGDGLFAIDTIVTRKGIEIVGTDASFDLNAVSLMMGSTLEKGTTNIWVLNELATVEDVSGTPTIAVEHIVSGNDVDISVRSAESNLVIAGAFTGVGGSAITGAGLSALVGKQVYVAYKRQVTDATWTDIMADEVPFPVHIIHHGSFQQKDGTFQGVETELYTCQAKGAFSIDAQRATASTSAVELQVIQPTIGKKLGTIKRFTDIRSGTTCGVLND